MATLPVHPDLDHLRHQAKDLLRAARSGDTAAVGRLRAVSERRTLAAAQLAIAREHGFASWARLAAAVRARADLDALAEAFCEASIRGPAVRAFRLLEASPEIAGHGFFPAVVLGDAARVRASLGREVGLATRPDPRTGWTPLHAACASRWHLIDPARADGLAAVAALLLDAGADPVAATPGRRGRPGGWTPLRCAVAGVGNPAVVRLLLERGAVPDDHDVYLACFAGDEHRCLRLLLDRVPDPGASTALAAPISIDDVEAVRLLLDAGVDPRRASPADLYGAGFEGDPPCPPVYGAVRSGAGAELVGLLLARGADPDAPGPDGRSPVRLATRHGREDVAALLRRHGARDDVTDAERFLAACARGDVGGAREAARDASLVERLAEEDMGGAMVRAAQAGDAAAVALMLDLGFPVGARSTDDDGATPLHAAAYAGSAPVVRLLLERGADIEARDPRWDSTPLDWAKVGSGERPARNPAADWVATVQTLLAAGASPREITLAPDDPKPASPEVAALLRAAGAGTRPPG